MPKSNGSKLPKAPSHLSATARTWWETVMTGYQLEEHHQHLLRLACEALDRAEEARAQLAVTGTTFQDKHGIWRPYPQVAIERESRIAFARLVRELDLDTGQAPAPGSVRPPPLHSNRWKT